MDKKFNQGENRFDEVKQTIGTIQSEGIYPSIVGFKRPLLYVLFKVIMPLPFAAILVFVDTVWIAVPSIICLLFGYFVLQLWFVQANTSIKELLNFGLFMTVCYISVLLFMEEHPLPRNYVGWFYIVILTVYFSVTSVG